MTPLWRELDITEAKRLLRKPQKVIVYDVTYMGLTPPKTSTVKRVTIQRIITKVVSEEDANRLLRHGWTLAPIEDSDNG